MKVFHSDPFDYQSIMDAIHGCSGLFYAYEPPHEQLPYDVSDRDQSKLALGKPLIELGGWSLISKDSCFFLAGIHGGGGGESCSQRTRGLRADRNRGEGGLHLLRHRRHLEGEPKIHPRVRREELERAQLLQNLQSTILYHHSAIKTNYQSSIHKSVRTYSYVIPLPIPFLLQNGSYGMHWRRR